LSKKYQAHKPAALTPAALKERAGRARQEGRFQQALEVVKQLYKLQPTPDHLELLKDTYLGRARQLRNQGQVRDAATVLEVAARLDESNTDWLEKLFAETARTGELPQALALLARVPEERRTGKLLGPLADAALVAERPPATPLPAALRDDQARIVEAFAQVEAGRDEQARTTLQAIGLRSPLLEWKLLLRGLQAYYQGDDARALENWQRLDPERIPYRLAAPFRLHLDWAFRTAQPGPAQAALEAQYDRLQGSGLLPQLRKLRAELAANRNSMAAPLRQAEALLPALRAEAPHLVPRLASCFYWAVLQTGPDDIVRYQRVFGAPADDPHFHRLRALAFDRAPNPTEAHESWQQYEKEIAAHPERWPDGQAARARALLWKHLGDNAATVPGKGEFDRIPQFLRDQVERPPSLNPSAEKCYQKSLQLAPDLLEAHEALFEHHLRADRFAQADKAARKLLQQHPDHVPTLGKLAGLLLEWGEPAEGLALLQRAVHNNPLDRRLRARVSVAHMLTARADTTAGRFPEARQHYQSAATFADPDQAGTVYARWAAGELKAGETGRADELLEQARANFPPLGVSYILMTEATRLKLGPALKKRFDTEFAAAAKEPPVPAAAVALLGYAESLHHSNLHYHGQKSHLKKATDYAARLKPADYSERHLVMVCRAMLDLGPVGVATRFLAAGKRRFRENPFFPYFEARRELRKGVQNTRPWMVQPLLEEAQRLARGASLADHSEDEVQAMLDDIDNNLRALTALNPFLRGGFYEDFFGGTFGDYDDDDDDDDDNW
jgi:hypothetical protein